MRSRLSAALLLLAASVVASVHGAAVAASGLTADFEQRRQAHFQVQDMAVSAYDSDSFYDESDPSLPAIIIPDSGSENQEGEDEEDDDNDEDRDEDDRVGLPTTGLRYSAYRLSGVDLYNAETARVAGQLQRAFGNSLPDRRVPILLLHGFLGFDNLLGVLDYFGGFTGNVKKHLEKLGYRVLVASVGPISSNWDRACELYAQIRGTVVDYGLSRSRRFGHNRYGRSYVGKGLYPEWGTKDHDDINIIAHSQGGPTARMLIHLLRNGHPEEDAAIEDARSLDPSHPDHGEVSPLLSARVVQPWVRSLVTISSPLRGTTIINVIDDWIPFIKTIVKGVYGLTGAVGPDGAFPYDFMLDHWGLTRQRGETLDTFLNRLKTSTFLKSESNGFFDNGVVGTRQVGDQFVKDDPSVYYFSVSNADTASVLLSNRQIAKPLMNLLIQPFANLMGSYSNKKQNVDGSWHEGDGIVNLISMDAPNTGRKVEYAFSALAAQPARPWLCPVCPKIQPSQVSAPRAGVWNHLGYLDEWDHLDVVGILSGVPKKKIYNLYENLAAIAAAIPARPRN